MEGKKKSLAKKLGITALIVFVLLMSATYGCIALFFEGHYFYNTIINGEDCSYKTPVEAEDLIYKGFHDYFLEITGREGMYDTVMPAEIELQYVFDDTLAKIKKQQNPLFWAAGFFKENSYVIPIHAEYDEAALDEKIKKLTFFRTENIRAPSEAYISYDSDEKKYVVIAGTAGTEIYKDKTVKAIREAIAGLSKEVNLEEEGCYKKAAVDEDNSLMKTLAEKANVYMAAEIIYDWNGNEVIVDGDTIHGWVIIEDDRVALDEEEIKEFVALQAKEYDTYGKNRIFQTADGREIELKSGPYGWKTDKDTECEELIKAIKSGETIEKQPAYTYTAAQSGQQDIGNTYVEIDLGKQHLYLFIDGEMIIESDFVSGNASRGWNTPAGVFGLTYKTKNAVLRGEGYETPVTYWMPFNGNIGMHDATWRSSFGGEIYQTNGSHGCINLPQENAKIIYEYVYTGFPVVCYY